MGHLDFARANLEFLLSELELRSVASVHIVYNVKRGGKFSNLKGKADIKPQFDRVIDLAGLKEARADCEFCSYVIDVVEEGDELKRTFD